MWGLSRRRKHALGDNIVPRIRSLGPQAHSHYVVLGVHAPTFKV